MFKLFVCAGLLVGSASAQPRPMVKPQPNLVEVVVEKAVDSGDAQDVDATAKQSLQARLSEAKLLAKLVSCAPAGRDAANVVLQMGKVKSRAISTGRTKAMQSCVESVVMGVKGAEITATLRVVWDPQATQHGGRGGSEPAVVPPVPKKKSNDVQPNPY